MQKATEMVRAQVPDQAPVQERVQVRNPKVPIAVQVLPLERELMHKSIHLVQG